MTWSNWSVHSAVDRYTSGTRSVVRPPSLRPSSRHWRQWNCRNCINYRPKVSARSTCCKATSRSRGLYRGKPVKWLYYVVGTSIFCAVWQLGVRWRKEIPVWAHWHVLLCYCKSGHHNWRHHHHHHHQYHHYAVVSARRYLSRKLVKTFCSSKMLTEHKRVRQNAAKMHSKFAHYRKIVITL